MLKKGAKLKYNRRLPVQHSSNLSTLKASSQRQDRENESDVVRSSRYYNTVEMTEENAKEET